MSIQRHLEGHLQEHVQPCSIRLRISWLVTLLQQPELTQKDIDVLDLFFHFHWLHVYG